MKLSIFVCQALLFVSCTAFHEKIYDIPNFEESLFNSVNSHRVSIGKTALIKNDNMCEIARKHSERMAKGEVEFGHGGFSERIDSIHTFLTFTSSSENCAMQGGTNDEGVAMQGWLDSPGHRQNLEGDYTHSGLGSAVKGNEIYTTQIFVKITQ